MTGAKAVSGFMVLLILQYNYVASVISIVNSFVFGLRSLAHTSYIAHWLMEVESESE